MNKMEFMNKNGDFKLAQPDLYRSLFFPIASEQGIKSVVTPLLGGDSKINQNAFILEPVSIENLHNNRGGRNFWCMLDQAVAWSAVGQSAESESLRLSHDKEKTELAAGFMWQKVIRESIENNLISEVLSFVPYDENVEIMHVKITNTSVTKRSIVPTAAIPIYGRSADNLRDHRHVTSLLHRIRTTNYGVYVRPTLSFDERGHHKNKLTYYVCGITGKGEPPCSYFPTVDSFLGEGGTYTNPETVLMNKDGLPCGSIEEGCEAFGGIRFQEQVLEPEQSVEFIILLGVTEAESSIDRLIEKYNSTEKVIQCKKETEEYWQKQVNVWFHTKDENFDLYMRWVSFQPFLRRIYGCSFLPYHDYGKGGRGWRDLWQDCLALLLMNPSGVRTMILDNFGGVRIDGTNATIIGEKQGEFIADRNNITRVWMDHGVWPLKTTSLYIEQTGDLDILNEQAPYFKDKQVARGNEIDHKWQPAEENIQKDINGNVVTGSVFEHLLLQNVCAFFEVGEHNHIRTRGADWNDALDMAEERGESVAFTCAYAGNLQQLAEYIRLLKEKKNQQSMELMEELTSLIICEESVYNQIQEKTEILKNFQNQCKHRISGNRIFIDCDVLANSLETKAQWIIKHVRESEWKQEDKHLGWFNGYYDNHGQAVEGIFSNQVRMILTSQVFSIMSQVATKEQVQSIVNSAVKYLYYPERGGFCINTDFKEEKYDLGRMFGFAYGTKENGAVFSHMTVMFSNALYQRGFVREGYLALQTLADTALNFETSKMFPGIPEYFDGHGRGVYQYLTGAASWYLLTMITEVFGVKGKLGDLLLDPKLVKEQFDEAGLATIELNFAMKHLQIQYRNSKHLDFGEYKILKVYLDNKEYPLVLDDQCLISRKVLTLLDTKKHRIEIELG